MCGLIRSLRPAVRAAALTIAERLLPGEPAAAVAEEQRAAPIGRHVADREQRRPALGQPAVEPVERDVADRNEPLAVALADDPDEAAVDRQFLDVEPERLADPQPGRVEQLEQGPRRGGPGPPRGAASTSSTVSVSGSSRGWRGRSMCWATSTAISPSPKAKR